MATPLIQTKVHIPVPHPDGLLAGLGVEASAAPHVPTSNFRDPAREFDVRTLTGRG
ncbi:MAG TPA: hypothetical protein VFW97_03690 [Acidimicrobiia bacterium]|nr:hypothetical protein [Acidimicrobiia bacterium]